MISLQDPRDDPTPARIVGGGLTGASLNRWSFITIYGKNLDDLGLFMIFPQLHQDFSMCQVKPKAGQLSELLERCEGIAAHEARCHVGI